MRISNAIALAQAKDKKLAVYIVDRVNGDYGNDFRMNDVYRFLHDHNVDYIDIVHTKPGFDVVKRAFSRKRFVLYIEGPDYMNIKVTARCEFSETQIKEVSKNFDESEFVEFLISDYCARFEESINRIKYFKEKLSATAIHTLYAIDDGRSYNELLLACNQSNIKTHAFQHGHFTKYHVGWLKHNGIAGKAITPNIIFVWSSFWRDELLRLGSLFGKEQIVVSGDPKAIAEKDQKVRGSNKQILFPYETVCPKDEVSEYIKNALHCDGVDVVFKCRPDVEVEKQLKEYSLQSESASNFHVITHLSEYDTAIDLVCGTYSTYLYEMVSQKVPIGILETSTDYGQGMVENDLADQISKESDICMSLDIAVKDGNLKSEARAKKLAGNEEKVFDGTLLTISKERGLL